MNISKLSKHVVLQGGTILDPVAGTEKKGDVHIADGKIKSVGKVNAPKSAQVVDCKGLVAVSYTHLTLPTIYSV